MKKKIIVNLILAFIVIPVLSLYQYFDNIVFGNYTIQDAEYSSLSVYLSKLLHQMGFPMSSLLFLFCVLMPFELVKRFFISGIKKHYFIITTICLLSIILLWLVVWGGPRVFAPSSLSVTVLVSFFLNGFIYLFSERKSRTKVI
ncbi:hypothetical protein HP439_02850 [Sphingobacterium shayense]|uniref:hypothetical protein n=1 Tax=Sphingobacterium shayense TaxID=626343 RepID=UPI001554BD66|nr:hypothetical protein [Sphingobacterium shayense]NQD69660.1 hypothetical protein [Sphingobacterium shayense]